jgi:ribosome-associated protein
MIPVTPTIELDDAEIELSFIRASGPGGQNVNKVSSAVQLRFDMANSPNLEEEVKERLARLAGQRLTKDGVIVLTADGHRTQERNKADAIARLVELIARAAHKPKPRKATRPSKAVKARRVDSKVKRGALKAGRRGRPDLE